MNSAPHTHTAAPVLGPRAATPGVAANPGPSVDHRRVESRLPVWLRGVFIIAVHHAFVLGLGARHGGIVELSEDSCGCVTVSARFTYLLLLTLIKVDHSYLQFGK